MQSDFWHAGNDKGTALSGPGVDNCTYNHATIYNSSITVGAELRKLQSSSHTPVLACHGFKILAIHTPKDTPDDREPPQDGDPRIRKSALQDTLVWEAAMCLAYLNLKSMWKNSLLACFWGCGLVRDYLL